jgi:transposase
MRLLEARLFAGVGAGTGTRQGHRRQAEPDWAAVHSELKRKHVTLNAIKGHSELIMEEARETGREDLLADTRRILAAAGQLLKQVDKLVGLPNR